MSYEFLEHGSDIGIRGTGRSEKEAFAETAKAMFAVMVDLKKIEALKTLKISVKAPDLEQLLVEWLNELIFQKDVSGIYFKTFKIDKLQKVGRQFVLKAQVKGGKIDPKKHQIKTEVKAATYAGLRCRRVMKKFFCQCVVDV